VYAQEKPWMNGVEPGVQAGGQLVVRTVDSLRPHPGWIKHQLAVPHPQLSALRERGDLAFVEPLVITADSAIIRGYAQWELARLQNRSVLQCVEIDASYEEALQLLLLMHRPSDGLNAFNRILLSLELEPMFKDKALANQSKGGLSKGSSNLTEADKIDVRAKIARAAGVSVGNITKVKQLKDTCVDELNDALYNDEISIHWAWKLRNASPEDQLDALGRLRFEKGLLTEIRQRAARRRKQGASAPQNAKDIVTRLNGLGRKELNAVRVSVVKSHEPEIFITDALARMIGWEQFRLWNQNTSCDNSPRIPETSGTGAESDRRSATISTNS